MSYKEEQYAEMYKETGDPKYRDMAVEEMRDLIYSTIKPMNISGGLDDRVLMNKAIAIALQSIETWDKSKSKLSTYIVNQLQPLRRDVYKFAPILHIPEHRIKNYGAFSRAYNDYVNNYGDQTVDTTILADMSGLTIKQVQTFLKENNKVFNDSVLSTNDIKWKKDDHRTELELIATEFKSDKLKSKMWSEIAKAITTGKKINATILAEKLNINYNVAIKSYNEIIDKVNEILTK